MALCPLFPLLLRLSPVGARGCQRSFEEEPGSDYLAPLTVLLEEEMLVTLNPPLVYSPGQVPLKFHPSYVSGFNQGVYS